MISMWHIQCPHLVSPAQLPSSLTLLCCISPNLFRKWLCYLFPISYTIVWVACKFVWNCNNVSLMEIGFCQTVRTKTALLGPLLLKSFPVKCYTSSPPASPSNALIFNGSPISTPHENELTIRGEVSGFPHWISTELGEKSRAPNAKNLKWKTENCRNPQRVSSLWREKRC